MTRVRGIGRALCAVGCTLFLVPVLASCTRHVLHSPYIKSSLAGENYSAALERLERINNGSSALLYLYEKGLILHYQGSLEESNRVFHAAEDLYFDLYTKSLSREVASLLTNETIIKYRGARYEAAMIHYYKILNYLQLGEPDGALVECRKLNNRLQVFMDDESAGFYVTDPFLQYLTGMVFQSRGEHNDAAVSFRLALQGFERLGSAFQVDFPRHLYCDMAMSAERLHDLQEAQAYREKGDCDQCAHREEDEGIVNVFVECGYVPYRIEEKVLIPIYKNEVEKGMDVDDFTGTLYDRYGKPRNHRRKLDYMMKIAVPKMVSVPFLYPDIDVRVTTDSTTETSYAQILENLNVLAHRTFEEDFVKMVIKTMARTLTKKIAHDVASDEDALAGLIVNLINIVTEVADTRSWTTLPRSVRVARLYLPEGTYDLDVTFYNAYGPGSEQITIPGVEVRAGRSTIVSYRVY